MAIILGHLSDHQNSACEDKNGDEGGQIFFTQVSDVVINEDCLYFCYAAAHQVFSHSVSPSIYSMYFCHTFHGLAIHTCFAFKSTCGLGQYEAKCEFVGEKQNMKQAQMQQVKFRIAHKKSLGTANCSFPFEDI